VRTPTTLYRYNLCRLAEKSLEKYKVKTGDTFTTLERDCKTLYRVRNAHIDFYGWATLKEAKQEYFQCVREEIYNLTEILNNKPTTPLGKLCEAAEETLENAKIR